MTGVLDDFAVVSVTFCVATYLSVMLVIVTKLAVAEPDLRRRLALPLMPAILQNIGIPLAALGFMAAMTPLEAIGGLLILLGLASRDPASASLNPNLEAPLLLSAILSFGLIGLTRSFA